MIAFGGQIVEASEIFHVSGGQSSVCDTYAIDANQAATDQGDQGRSDIPDRTKTPDCHGAALCHVMFKTTSIEFAFASFPREQFALYQQTSTTSPSSQSFRPPILRA